MTQAMRQYADYRASGDDWLGKIPGHWRSTSLGVISKRKSSRNRPDLPLLSVLREKGVILRSSLSLGENHNFIPDNLNNYQVACEGDLVVNKMKAWQGSVGIAPQNGIVSPAYYIFELTEIKKKYAHRLLRSRLYADFFGRASDGIRIGQWDLGIPAMKRIPVVIPHPEEQDAIARYLDDMDRRIARFIRNRRRLIEVLNEQKQAIINRAVTRGLVPNAPLKPSGIDWFPQVPEGWSAVPLRRVITRAVDGPHHSPSYVDTGVTFISARNIKVDRWSLDDAKYISKDDYLEFCRRIKPEVGDVLYTKGGTTGVARAVDIDCPFQVWVHVAVLKLRHNIVHPDYLALVLNSTPCYQQSQLYTRGATNQDLGLGRMKAIFLSLPPSLEEQKRIVARVRQETSIILAAIDRAKSEIDLIREYRTRLISDVVTGKVDVRHLAPPPGSEDLDETVESLEPLEEDIADAVIDDEESVNEPD